MQPDEQQVWSQDKHRVFPLEFRRAVRTVLLVANRSGRALSTFLVALLDSFFGFLADCWPAITSSGLVCTCRPAHGENLRHGGALDL
eukprot:SAG22_NODE_2584_length_2416_cov_1.294346_2_plen_87_part_00